MHSIRSKITALTLSAIIVVITITTVISAIEIKKFGNDTSEQILYLLCEEGEKNLDNYFDSIEQSVETVANYAEDDLRHTDISDISSHLDRVEDIFEKTSKNTNGILTYYYRIDPEISTTNKGFWYVDLDGSGFKEHELTDITQYNAGDQSQLVWFTVPKATGSSVWLNPYFTDNLDVYVLSYNVPIKKDGRFVGVIGIEINYNTIIAPVKNISFYKNGYAFITDNEGNLIYHPHIDISEYTGENKPKAPEEMMSDSVYINYTYNGVEKLAVWKPLDNGMRLYMTVPSKEINAEWIHLTSRLFAISFILLLLFALLAIRFSVRITRPLENLKKAALQVDSGDYDIELNYNKNDEVGALTNSFKQLIAHLKVYINDLNNLAYSDPLTSVHNKGAFDIYIRNLQSKIKESDEKVEFGIGIFDCNRLKYINDNFGHEKGDLYLQATVCLICNAFPHSPVFRIGGDEFAVIIMNDDYNRRNELTKTFTEHIAEHASKANADWKKISVAMGMAVYDPKIDSSAESVVSRADKLMYVNKNLQKQNK